MLEFFKILLETVWSFRPHDCESFLLYFPKNETYCVKCIKYKNQLEKKACNITTSSLKKPKEKEVVKHIEKTNKKSNIKTLYYQGKKDDLTNIVLNGFSEKHDIWGFLGYGVYLVEKKPQNDFLECLVDLSNTDLKKKEEIYCFFNKKLLKNGIKMKNNS